MKRLIDILHQSGCSCVIASQQELFIGRERGIKDLYHLFKNTPQLLCGSAIADKVVGKGAAALMALGGVARLYADVISRPALTLLEEVGVAVSYSLIVPNIINRAGTDICPVEALCAACATPAECLPEIEHFINANHSTN